MKLLSSASLRPAAVGLSWAVVREGGEVAEMKPLDGRVELQGRHDQSSRDK